MECPIMCGRCCYDPVYGEYEQVCTYWRNNKGCILPREERPQTCNLYLCEKARERADRLERTSR